MLIGHEISTDFCNMRVEGDCLLMNPWRGRRRKVWKSRERSTLQNPQEAFRGPKYRIKMEVIQSKMGNKKKRINISGSLFLYLHNNEKKIPLYNFLWELNVCTWNNRPQFSHQHTYIVCLECLCIYFNPSPYLGKMKRQAVSLKKVNDLREKTPLLSYSHLQVAQHNGYQTRARATLCRCIHLQINFLLSY